MKADVVTITPAKAKTFIAMNTGNYRKYCKKRVASLSKAMDRGDWELNGESIKISSEGVLLDGQHRLLAVIDSGVTIKSLVVTGITSDARTIDRGQARSIAQWLSHEGVPNAKNIAAISRWSVCHDKGFWSRESLSISEALDSEVIEYAHKHLEELQSAARLASRANRILPVSILGTVFHVGTRGTTDNTIAEWFCQALISGDNLTDVDAVLHLRNRLISQTAHSKISASMLRGLVTLAWNKTVKGEGCTASGLRIRVTGPKPQKYPSMILCIDAGSEGGE